MTTMLSEANAKPCPGKSTIDPKRIAPRCFLAVAPGRKGVWVPAVVAEIGRIELEHKKKNIILFDFKLPHLFLNLNDRLTLRIDRAKNSSVAGGSANQGLSLSENVRVIRLLTRLRNWTGNKKWRRKSNIWSELLILNLKNKNKTNLNS